MTAYATCALGSGGNLLWWAWECRCGSLLARTYRTADGGLLDTLLEERQPVRIRDAELDGIPAFGLRARVRKEQQTSFGSPSRVRRPKPELAVRLHAAAGKATRAAQQASDYIRWMPSLFDTWCAGCGQRNRVDVARRIAVVSPT